MTRNSQTNRSAQKDDLRGSRWIWCDGADPVGYNQTVCFRKEFTVRERREACLRIVADSWYRVRVNGVWIHDGPARAYPEELVYDEHDCTSALIRGKNRIEVIVRYFGCGTFHQIPCQGALRAALWIGEGTVVGTDASWQAAPCRPGGGGRRKSPSKWNRWRNTTRGWPMIWTGSRLLSWLVPGSPCRRAALVCSRGCRVVRWVRRR